MLRKILVGGVTAAVILGAGTAALAVSGSDTTNGAPAGSSTSSAGHAKNGTGKHGKGKHKVGQLLRRLDHGSVVTKTKQGFVTHNLIKGTATAVSATSITVRSADKTTETFAITKDTKVRARADGKAAPSTIAKVAKGDLVFVGGTGTSTLTAKHVIDRGTK